MSRGTKSSDDLQVTVNRDLLRGLRPLFAFLFWVYLFYSFYEYTVFEPPYVWVVTAVNFVLAITFGGWSWAIRRELFGARLAHPLLALCAILVLGSVVDSFVMIPEVIYTIYVVLILVIFGSYSQSLGWIALVSAIVVITWSPLVVWFVDPSQAVHHIVSLVVGVAASVSIHLGRKRIIVRLQESLLEEGKVRGELEESEARYRLLFNEMTSGFALHEVLTDDTGAPQDLRILEVNQSFEELMGMDREQTIGRLLREQIPELQEQMIAVAGTLDDVVAKVTDFEYYHPLNDRHLEVRAYSPAPGLLAALFIDVTTRKQIEEQRGALREQIERARRVEALGRMAGGMAHDFNNLLTPVLTTSELLLESGDLEPAVRDDLREIMAAGSRARDLTTQLLAISRRQVLMVRSYDLSKLALSIEPILKRLLHEDIVLELKLGEEPVWANVDRTQLDQVLMNLALNAQDAMPKGGHLRLETDVVGWENLTPRPGVQIDETLYGRLRVTDDGHGMDSETMKHIFEPFFTTKGENVGTGLGLATVFGIVSQHHGQIWVDSSKDNGTTFTVIFPLSEPGVSRSSTPEEASQPIPGGEGRVVLVVEDEPQVRSAAARTLRKLDYEVLVAATPDEALSTSDSFGGVIDVLLTDIVMPIMDGVQLYDRLRHERPEMKVVYMSGYTEDVLAAKGITGKDIPFIPKPFTVGLLARTLRAVCEEAS